MNLHAIAGPIVAAVNPTVFGRLWTSDGYITSPSGKRSPTYSLTPNVALQVQALSAPELAQTESLNIEGVKRAVYVNGDVQGVDRVDGKGGDLLDFNAKRWLVVTVLETWPGWCKVAVALQLDGALDAPGASDDPGEI